jgi:hypothetical protein
MALLGKRGGIISMATYSVCYSRTLQRQQNAPIGPLTPIRLPRVIVWHLPELYYPVPGVEKSRGQQQ